MAILTWVWRYQRVNRNPYIEEEQTTQWPKENVQKDKQRSTKHTYKTKDRVTRTPLKMFRKIYSNFLFQYTHLAITTMTYTHLSSSLADTEYVLAPINVTITLLFMMIKMCYRLIYNWNHQIPFVNVNNSSTRQYKTLDNVNNFTIVFTTRIRSMTPISRYCWQLISWLYILNTI